MENIVRKGEIACNKQSLLFSQRFLPYMVLISNLKIDFKMSSAISFDLDQSKILSSGNWLTQLSTLFQLYHGSNFTYLCFSRVSVNQCYAQESFQPCSAFPHTQYHPNTMP